MVFVVDQPLDNVRLKNNRLWLLVVLQCVTADWLTAKKQVIVKQTNVQFHFNYEHLHDIIC